MAWGCKGIRRCGSRTKPVRDDVAGVCRSPVWADGSPSAIGSIQESDPVHCEGDGREILLHLSLQNIGSHVVQHVAEFVVHLGEENRLIDTGGHVFWISDP